MELAIDEALPQPLLPWVDGQVVEAEHVAPLLACIFDNQGLRHLNLILLFIAMAISLMSVEAKSLEP